MDRFCGVCTQTTDDETGACRFCRTAFPDETQVEQTEQAEVIEVPAPISKKSK